MTVRRILLLINRQSRQGADLTDAVKEVFTSRGVEVDEAPPCEPDEIADHIRAVADKVDLVVVGGGDGSVHNALPGLLKAEVPFAVVPLGTANDLARTLGLPADPLAAAGLALGGARRRIDIGLVNGHPFVNVANIGLSVDITRELRRDLKKRWGVLAYPIAAARAVFKRRPFTAEIRMEHETIRVRSIQIGVGSGEYYGGGMLISEHASISDGQLRFYSVAPRSVGRMILDVFRWRRGQHGRAERTVVRSGTWFEVSTRRRRSITSDGEMTTHTPARFEILPQALEVVIPAAAQPAEHVAAQTALAD